MKTKAICSESRGSLRSGILYCCVCPRHPQRKKKKTGNIRSRESCESLEGQKKKMFSRVNVGLMRVNQMMYIPLPSPAFMERIKYTQPCTAAVRNQKLYFESFTIDSQPFPARLRQPSREQFKVKLIFLSGEI